MDQLRVEELMTKQVRSVTPGCTLRDVATWMHQHRFSCVVVCQEEVPVGVITERDLARVMASTPTDQIDALTAEEVMSSPVATVSGEATLSRAVSEAAERQIRRLIVVFEDGRLEGLVTQTDLLRAHSRELERLVEERTRALREANARLDALHRQDGLLQIGNRRGLQLALERLHATAARYKRPYGVVLFDVDGFKAYNDSLGHLAGDEILKQISSLLLESLRHADSLYRYGGDEILALLPETDLEGSRQLAERARSTIREAARPHPGAPSGIVTLSCGVAAIDHDGAPQEDIWQVVAAADRGLYVAKRAGRDRVGVDEVPAAVG